MKQVDRKHKRPTRSEASALARALIGQLKVRLPDLVRDISLAYGIKLPLGAGHEKRPPEWALAAIRRMFSARGSMGIIGAGGFDETDWSAEHWGRLIGITRMWAAILGGGTAESAQLEKSNPQLTAFRKEIADIIKPLSDQIARVGDAKKNEFEITPSPQAKILAEFWKGLHKGGTMAVDSNGESKDDLTATQTICFFIWLYAPDIARLETMTEVKKIFELFHETEVTSKLLEKVARDLKLKLKERGAPRKQFRLPRTRK